MAVILQVVGKKKSGKTTTMLSFIEAATQMGLRVASFKHTHHSVSMDQAGTDTDRFAKAGAGQVGLQNEAGFFWREQRALPEPTLAQEIATFVNPKTDLILIEGFKTEDYQKVLLLRPKDQLADFKLTQIQTIASLYSLTEKEYVDFSEAELRKKWFEEWYQKQGIK